MGEEGGGGAGGDGVAAGLDGGGAGVLGEHLAGGACAVLEGHAGFEHEPVVGFEVLFTEGPAVAFELGLGDGRLGGAGEAGDPAVAELEEVACGEAAAGHIIAFDADEVLAEWGAGTEHDHARAASAQIGVDGGEGGEPVDRGDEEPFHASGEEAPEAKLFAIGLVEGLGEEEIEAELVGAFFEGEEEPAGRGVRDIGEEDAEESAGSGAEALGHDIGHVAHLLGDGADAELGGGGDIGCVTEDAGHGHDRDSGLAGDVDETNHQTLDPLQLSLFRKVSKKELSGGRTSGTAWGLRWNSRVSPHWSWARVWPSAARYVSIRRLRRRTSMVEARLTMTERFERVWGQMGVRAKTSAWGLTTAPPAARE